jgi:hypothetical protein
MPNEAILPIPTAEELCAVALRKAGIVGIDEAIEEPVLNDAFLDLNDLLSQWQRNRYLVWRLSTYSFTSTGAQTYLVGMNQTVNINPRPDRLESAFLRITNGTASNLPVDLPLDIISSKEDYNRIVIKTLGTLPWRIFYDPGQDAPGDTGWQIGTLYPWPVPQASIYQIFVTFKEVLNRFQTLQSKINLPPEYIAAIKWGLTEVLRASYQLPPDMNISKFARRSLNSIRLANVAVPTLTMPNAVSTRRRAYDYHSDT